MNSIIVSKNNITFKNYKTKNLEITSGTIQGNRKENNDVLKIDNINNTDIFLLADGHGGNYISKIICNKILFNFFKGFKFHKFDKTKILFKSIDKEIYKHYYCKNFKREGTTLTCIIINNDNIIALNLGDSNYVIKKDKEYVTGTIHRLNNKSEINRVINNKYKIIKIGNNFRIDGKLELTRSFGDYYYKVINNKYCGNKSAVICTPCYKKIDYTFKFILMATDGFWDYISNEEAINIVDNLISIISLSKIIEKLIKIAISNGSNDNITIILIKKCG